MSSRPPTLRISMRDVPWRLVFGVWSVPVLTDTADTVITEHLAGHSIEVWRAFAIVAPGWYLWAVLTPVIFWLGRRFPLRRPLRVYTIMTQLALGVGAGLCHALVLSTRASFYQLNRPPRPWGSEFFMALSDWLPVSIVIYWAILGFGAAIDNFRRYREQELRASELSARLARSELAMLRAQLQPHFLFNALNAGVSLVRAGQPDRGARVLTHLGELLRPMLAGDTAPEHTLGEELAFLRSYLEIELVRFENRLTVHVDVPDELLDTIVPSLTLQPLVENAVRHGIAPRDAPGRIDITARVDGDALVLRVVDDGLGMPPGADATASAGGAGGVGLSNTRARLGRMYGDAGSLRIAAVPGGGVDATVHVPLRRSSASAGPAATTSLPASRDGQLA